MSIPEIMAYLLALIFAITTHEAAHGMVAYAFGDDTAKQHGRLTFNPLAHLDWIGTVLLPGLMVLTHAPFMFGWAKPVPVDFDRLHPRRLGLILVAFAGPAVNLILAWFSLILLQTSLGGTTFNHDFLTALARVNLVLAAFNLLPFLPLDGGRILTGLLPKSLAESYARTERYGMLTLMVLILMPALLAFFGIHFSPIIWVLSPVYEMLASIVKACADVVVLS
jgi:Zn-dependent protease